MKKLLSLSLALLLVLSMFSACGASSLENKGSFDSAVSMPEADYEYSYGWVADEEVVEDAVEEPYYPEKGNSIEADNLPATERKIIKNIK